MTEVDVVSVNVGARLALRSDDVLGSIVTLIDACGEDTDDASQAVTCVAEWLDGGFTAIDLRDFEARETN